MKALIIDDDPNIVEVVSLCFEIRWPDAVLIKAPDGATDIKRFKEEGADIVILDLGLPDMDGVDVCHALKKAGDVAIIILTVRDQPNDIVKGLEWDADDYITKPFDQLEFLARVTAVLRRRHHARSFLQRGGALQGDYCLRHSQRLLTHYLTLPWPRIRTGEVFASPLRAWQPQRITLTKIASPSLATTFWNKAVGNEVRSHPTFLRGHAVRGILGYQHTGNM